MSHLVSIKTNVTDLRILARAIAEGFNHKVNSSLYAEGEGLTSYEEEGVLYVPKTLVGAYYRDIMFFQQDGTYAIGYDSDDRKRPKVADLIDRYQVEYAKAEVLTQLESQYANLSLSNIEVLEDGGYRLCLDVKDTISIGGY